MSFEGPFQPRLFYDNSVIVKRSWVYKTAASLDALGNTGRAARAASCVLQAWKNGQLSLLFAAQGWLWFGVQLEWA